MIPSIGGRTQVAAYVRGGDNTAVGGGGVVEWESDGGQVIASSWFEGSAPGRDQWFWLKVTARVPEGAGFASFDFGVETPTACSTPAVAIFDDVFLGRIAPDLFGLT